MYIKGVSTRRVTKIMEKLCGFQVSSTQVSKLTMELDAEFGKWLAASSTSSKTHSKMHSNTSPDRISKARSPPTSPPFSTPMTARTRKPAWRASSKTSLLPPENHLERQHSDRHLPLQAPSQHQGSRPKINPQFNEIADEGPGLRQPAAAFRHAACCERGKRRFHRAFPVPMPPASQQGCIAQSYSRL